MKTLDNHYKAMKIQPKEMYAYVPEFAAYPMLVSIKYVARARFKGQEARDLEQAHNTLEWCQDVQLESITDPFPRLDENSPGWFPFINQYDDETSYILMLIGLQNFGAARLLIRRRLAQLGTTEGLVKRGLRYFRSK